MNKQHNNQKLTHFCSRFRKWHDAKYVGLMSLKNNFFPFISASVRQSPPECACLELELRFLHRHILNEMQGAASLMFKKSITDSEKNILRADLAFSCMTKQTAAQTQWLAFFMFQQLDSKWYKMKLLSLSKSHSDENDVSNTVLLHFSDIGGYL